MAKEMPVHGRPAAAAARQQTLAAVTRAEARPVMARAVEEAEEDSEDVEEADVVVTEAEEVVVVVDEAWDTREQLANRALLHLLQPLRETSPLLRLPSHD